MLHKGLGLCTASRMFKLFYLCISTNVNYKILHAIFYHFFPTLLFTLLCFWEVWRYNVKIFPIIMHYQFKGVLALFLSTYVFHSYVSVVEENFQLYGFPFPKSNLLCLILFQTNMDNW